MIFNYTIYGNTGTSTTGLAKLFFYRKNLAEVFTKEFTVLEGKYQFNLGDFDLLNINGKIESGDICLIEFWDTVKLFSGYVPLDIKEDMIEFNLDFTSYIETSDIANFSISEVVIKTTNHAINESSNSLYNYFTITNLETNEVIENNAISWKYVPTDSNNYLLSQKALNVTSNILSSKEYQFKAIVATSSISSSNKCKSINDAIKILFLGYDTAIPSIKVIKDDAVIESGIMTSEGNSLFSWNYVFPSEGHFCFRIDFLDESFITNFRVLRNNFKIYFIDESLTPGLPLTAEYFFINDLSTSLGFISLTSITNGLYSGPELNVQYGDYMFKIQDTEYVTSFEECTSLSSSVNSITSIQEEVYWVFPNMNLS